MGVTFQMGGVRGGTILFNSKMQWNLLLTMLTRILISLCFVFVLVLCQELSEDPRQVKRFYSWEDAKRSPYDVEELKELMTKRKQFYAWAGKRSSPMGGQMEKRKPFYAWAGRK